MKLQGSEGAKVLGLGSKRWLAVTERALADTYSHISMKFSPAALAWIYFYI